MAVGGVSAVFLERDGMLIPDSGFPHREDQLVILPGAAEAVRRLNKAGYLVFATTNQPAVGRGVFTEAQMEAFNQLLIRRLAVRGALLTAVYACPFSPDAALAAYNHPDHPDRKPNPGMLLRAMADHRIDPARAFLIGLGEADLEAARRAGLPGFRFDGVDLDAYVHELLGG